MLRKLVTHFIILLIVLTSSSAYAYPNEPTGWKNNAWGISYNDIKSIHEFQPVPPGKSREFNVIPNIEMDIYQSISDKKFFLAFINNEFTATYRYYTLPEMGTVLRGQVLFHGEPIIVRPNPKMVLFGWKGSKTVISLIADEVKKVVLLSHTSTEALAKHIKGIKPPAPEKRKQERDQPRWNDPRYYGPGRRIAEAGVIY